MLFRSPAILELNKPLFSDEVFIQASAPLNPADVKAMHIWKQLDAQFKNSLAFFKKSWIALFGSLVDRASVSAKYTYVAGCTQEALILQGVILRYRNSESSKIFDSVVYKLYSHCIETSPEARQ